MICRPSGHNLCWRLTVLTLIPLLSGCTTTAEPVGNLARDAIPRPAREFRAAWVATVANIDWPSKPGLAVTKQQAEADAILDRLVALNMNAVVFQVRPHADAMYWSELEPWSYYLTGAQGRPPDPAYDPLQYWIEGAHARGLQLHAWFNPYRANHPAQRGEFSDRSIVREHPDYVVRLGDKGYLWMDPSLRPVQDHSVAVVRDVVARYDVDGVHFDDYFYPYRSYNDGADFPDDGSFARYRADGGKFATRADWRRAAVDHFIERVRDAVHAEKPHVEFGISPFGIWRPGHPPSIRGLDQYDVLYADAKRWWNEGWVDYLTPQLYWPIAQIPQSFPVLLGWWHRENTRGRHLWPGTTMRRLREPGGAKELLHQIMITRGMTPHAPGLCFFSMRGLMQDATLGEQLTTGPYASSALIPASPWLDSVPPRSPAVEVRSLASGHRIEWQPRGDEAAFLWVVYVKRNDTWEHRILPGSARSFDVPHDAANAESRTLIAVTAVDRTRNESALQVVSCPPRETATTGTTR